MYQVAKMSEEPGKKEEWDYENGLRILYYPVLSSNTVVDSSPSYHRLVDMVEWMDEFCDFPHYWHVLWPKTWDEQEEDPELEDDPRYRYQYSGPIPQHNVENYDNVELLKMRYHVCQPTDMTMCTRELREAINIAEGDTYYDLFINDRPSITPMLNEQMRARKEGDKSLPPTIVQTQIIPRHKKGFGESTQLRTILALLEENTYMLYENNDQKRWMEDIARDYVRPTMIERMQEQAMVQPLGLNYRKIDEVTADVEKQDDPVLINYGSKLYGQRNYQEAWQIVDIMNASGRNIEMQVVTPSMSPWAGDTELEYNEGIDYFNVYEGLTKEEYLRQSAKAKMMIDASKETGFNLTLMEVVYMGALPVVREAGWSKYFYGEDYPFYFNGKKNGAKMAIHVYDNLEEYREEWIPKLRERFKEKFSFDSYIERILTEGSNIREDVTFDDDFFDIPKSYHERYEGNPVQKAVLKALRRVDNPFRMEEFDQEYKDVTENNVELVSPLDGRSPTAHVKYYWLLKKAGVVDLCEDADPLMDKSAIEGV